MKKRTRNLGIAFARKIVNSCGGILNSKTMVAEFQYDRDGIHGHAAWAVIGNGPCTVSIQLALAPEGVYIAGNDAWSVQDRPDHPDGKWEAAHLLYDHGVLQGTPWSAYLAKYVRDWARPDNHNSKQHELAHLHRSKRSMKEWIRAAEGSGADEFICSEDAYGGTITAKSKGHDIGTFSVDKCCSTESINCELEESWKWRWSDSYKHLTKYA